MPGLPLFRYLFVSAIPRSGKCGSRGLLPAVAFVFRVEPGEDEGLRGMRLVTLHAAMGLPLGHGHCWLATWTYYRGVLGLRSPDEVVVSGMAGSLYAEIISGVVVFFVLFCCQILLNLFPPSHVYGYVGSVHNASGIGTQDADKFP